MTELELAVPYSGIDPHGRVKFSVLLEMFQEMADADASKYGLSVHQTLEHDITWVLRKYLSDMNPVEAMEFLQKQMSLTDTNEEFLATMNH